MKEIMSSNIPQLSVNEVIKTLSLSYSTIIKNKTPIKDFPSVMLWGAPGVGKSQAIRQIAQNIQDATGKKTFIKDVRLLLFNPIDLRGIPTANADKTLAVWLKPEIFQLDNSDQVVNILFLDEITAAPQSVQAAAYQITLDRVIGEHKLPDNCIVIAAGNRITDKSVSFKMPKALANRLMHFQIENNFDMWKQWAVRKGIHPYVTGFLSFKQNYLMNFDASVDDLAFATPRSWEMVSNILYSVTDNFKVVFNQIAGLVGLGVALELENWTKVYKDLPSIEDIFNGKKPKIPKSTDTLYALTASMTAYAQQHKDDMRKIAHSIAYADLLPADYSVLVMKDYLYLDKDYKSKLLQLREFNRWLNNKGRLLNES